MLRDNFAVPAIVAAVVVILAAVVFSSPAASIGVTQTSDDFLPFVAKEPAGSGLPDLIINSISITLEDPTCYDGNKPFGLRVFMENAGLGDAGSFVIEVEGVTAVVNGLAAGERSSVWLRAYSVQPLAIIDATNLVAESDEENNVYNELLPVATLPPPCAILTPGWPD